MNYKTQRDLFIDELFHNAKSRNDIYFISVDMGAPALDQWRDRLPNQFISAGISEQNAINIAAGLSSQNKQVFVYFMACWTARCLEQIRYSVCMAQNPITILANGVGLGYAPAGPAHEPNEDIAYVRSLEGVDVYMPSNLVSIRPLANKLVNSRRTNYVRLERSVDPSIDLSIDDLDLNTYLGQGYRVIRKSKSNNSGAKFAILSYGYPLTRCIQAIEHSTTSEISEHFDVVDVLELQSFYRKDFIDLLSEYEALITVEEQFSNGGFGSTLLEAFSKFRKLKRVERVTLNQSFIFDNGTREQLLNKFGLGISDIFAAMREVAKAND